MEQNEQWRGGTFYMLLRDLQVNVSTAADEFEQAQQIIRRFLELVVENCRNDVPGVALKLRTKINIADREDTDIYTVGEDKLKLWLMPFFDEDEDRAFRCLYDAPRIGVWVKNGRMGTDEVYGPRYGRGASCDIVVKDGIASFANPRFDWIS